MLVIDTSALVAIAFEESRGPSLTRTLTAYEGWKIIGAPNFVELVLVLQRRFGGEAQSVANDLIAFFGLHIEEFTEADTRLASVAAHTYGKGNHPAGLNYGDLMAYALAKRLGAPLLYVGDDFSQTDVTAVPIV